MGILLSSAALVLSNLAPLVGVLFFGWSLPAIMFLYWAENIIVGSFTVLKIYQAQGTAPSGLTIDNQSADHCRPRTLVRAFLLNYGLFTLAHGLFVMFFFGVPRSSWAWFASSFFVLVASHGISYWSNFIRGGERLRVSAASQFVHPYQRLGVLHLTLVLGALAAARFGSLTAILVVMVVVKILIDLTTHIRLHYRQREGHVPPPVKFSLTVPTRKDAIGMTVICGLMFLALLFLRLFVDADPFPLWTKK